MHRGFFHRHHGGGAVGHYGTGHDPAGGSAQRKARIAGGLHAVQGNRRARRQCQMCGAQREAVHGGVIETGQGFRRDEVFGQHMAQRGIGRKQHIGLRTGALAHGRKGLLEGNHGAPA